jgi:hypothetical protein
MRRQANSAMKRNRTSSTPPPRAMVAMVPPDARNGARLKADVKN